MRANRAGNILTARWEGGHGLQREFVVEGRSVGGIAQAPRTLRSPSGLKNEMVYAVMEFSVQRWVAVLPEVGLSNVEVLVPRPGTWPPEVSLRSRARSRGGGETGRREKTPGAAGATAAARGHTSFARSTFNTQTLEPSIFPSGKKRSRALWSPTAGRMRSVYSPRMVFFFGLVGVECSRRVSASPRPPDSSSRGHRVAPPAAVPCWCPDNYTITRRYCQIRARAGPESATILVRADDMTRRFVRVPYQYSYAA